MTAERWIVLTLAVFTLISTFKAGRYYELRQLFREGMINVQRYAEHWGWRRVHELTGDPIDKPDKSKNNRH